MFRQASPPHARHPLPPRPRSPVHLVVDACVAPATFLVTDMLAGARWAALAALGAAVLAGCVRRIRGEPLGVVAGSTILVLFHSASAFAVGEGRAYFLPEFVVNGAGLIVFSLSLAVRRPITRVLSRRLGASPEVAEPDTAMERRHRRLTLAWIVMWILHLALLTLFYSLSSVAGLAATSAFDKITLFAMAAFTAVAVRRAATVRGDRSPALGSVPDDPTVPGRAGP